MIDLQAKPRRLIINQSISIFNHYFLYINSNHSKPPRLPYIPHHTTSFFYFLFLLLFLLTPPLSSPLLLHFPSQCPKHHQPPPLFPPIHRPSHVLQPRPSFRPNPGRHQPSRTGFQCRGCWCSISITRCGRFGSIRMLDRRSRPKVAVGGVWTGKRKF